MPPPSRTLSVWAEHKDMEPDCLQPLWCPDPSDAEALRKVLDVTLEEALLVEGTTAAAGCRSRLARSRCSRSSPARRAVLWHKVAASQNRARRRLPILSIQLGELRGG
jgi:hypothetical protein